MYQGLPMRHQSQSDATHVPGKRLLRIRDVNRITGLSRTHIYRLMKAGAFPRSISLGPKTTSWLESEVTAWVDAQVAARDAGSAAVSSS